MKQDRFLKWILVGIVLLAIISVSLFYYRQGEQVYGKEDTPEGVLRNYALALQNEDYSRAYSYIAEFSNKPSEFRFKQAYFTNEMSIKDNGLQIGTSRILATEAVVDVVIIQANTGPFGDTWRNNGTAQLVQQDGKWKIRNMLYPYWGWDWSVEVSPELKAPAVPKGD